MELIKPHRIWLSKCNIFRAACKKRRNVSDSICWCEWRQITPSLADDAALLNQNMVKINKPKEDTCPVLTHWMKHEHQLTSGDDDLTVGWAVSHFRSSLPPDVDIFQKEHKHIANLLHVQDAHVKCIHLLSIAGTVYHEQGRPHSLLLQAAHRDKCTRFEFDGPLYHPDNSGQSEIQ